jgi:hypothetical protein
MRSSWITIRLNESDHDLISLFEHDLFEKPVPTFSDHAHVFVAEPDIEPRFAAITPVERTGKGTERAMANGVVLGTKLKPAHHQRLESIARPNAGESMTDIGRSYNFSHRTIRRLRWRNRLYEVGVVSR